MIRALPILFLIFLASVGWTDDSAPIPDFEADQHIGEQAIVRGPITQLKISKGGAVFLDMGERYPNQSFTIWIPKNAYSVTVDRPWLEALKGKTVDVKGGDSGVQRKA
jgi:hypothetical protein